MPLRKGVVLVAAVALCAPSVGSAQRLVAPSDAPVEPSDSMVVRDLIEAHGPLASWGGVTMELILRRSADGNTVIASANSDIGEGYPGHRLWLFKRDPAGTLQLLHRTDQFIDASWLTPELYETGDETLLLADHGNDYSWGLLAFFVEDELRRSPLPGLAYLAPLEEMSELGPGESALPFVDVVGLPDALELRFDVNLILAPGRRDQLLVCLGDGPTVLRYESRAWSMKAGPLRTGLECE